MKSIESRVQRLEEAEGIGNEKNCVCRIVEGDELKRLLRDGDAVPSVPMIGIGCGGKIAVLVPMKEGTY